MCFLLCKEGFKTVVADQEVEQVVGSILAPTQFTLPLCHWLHVTH